jgi:hypothetical protein
MSNSSEILPEPGSSSPRESARPASLQSLIEYWGSIPFGLRLLIGVEAAALMGSTGVLVVVALVGKPIASAATDLELVLLGFTIVVITLLTEHSTRSSSRGVQELVELTRAENRLLIEENKAHWSEQRQLFEGLLQGLSRLTELQVQLIDAVRHLDEAQREALRQQAVEAEARRQALRKEIEDQAPSIKVRMRGWEGKIIKHFLGIISNDGPPGADLDVTFSLGGVQRSARGSLVSKGAPFEADFGDISEFPDSGQVSVVCEVSSANKAHRYRSMTLFDYSRNRGFWGSSPKLVRTSPEVPAVAVLY